MDDLRDYSRIHIVGVGGAGMSALAKILSGLGHRVSGSDLRLGPATKSLGDLGLDVWSGHRPAAMAGIDLVVASSAVPDRDPELAAAQAQGIPTWRRPRLLSALSATMPTIGVTGTHGKTSSTAMMITALRAAGTEPTFVVGGDLVEFRTNAAIGRDDLFVLEVDEAFGTFEHIHLRGLVVTNVEAEHLDHFGTLEDLEDAFTRVVRGVDGPVVVCADDPGSAKLAARTGVPTFGLGAGSDWRISDVVERVGSSEFTLSNGTMSVLVRVPRTGLHMVRNAGGVLALLGECGYDLDRCAAGIAGFAGVKRRFEHRGTIDGISVIDDYAHHPTEVAATIREAVARSPRRVIAIFQPHLYTRTQRFAGEFGGALALADSVVVTNVYGSREEPIPGITGALVADAATRAGAADVHYVPHLGDVPDVIASLATPGDLILTLGAGDVTILGPEILAAVESR
ncbi:MAG: UDP-N-acetylmuramate--L-alanine ligase [Acidimicrobiia bacterium]|nr:UDP-N-acetylmuramate--L-alanine ligase [Acidimicrobiia bacterium]MDH4307357.1 UDP-N-acetylmuramate--L-alanine ligase [Acidimicrobiia bacterium]